ncbi:heparinase II/III family protein [Bradyrhizobium sp.]|uniref:heparinase II/III family protein n=1 Tax=Bradyrhizobium sp. TaxID=376 RepID=UPI003C787D0D
MRLGAANVLRVAAYRALLKVGAYRYLLPAAASIEGPFFDWTPAAAAGRSRPDVGGADWDRDAQRIIAGELRVFSDRWVHTGFPPDWARSVLTDVPIRRPSRHWTRIADFGLEGGDVKGYWEPARFDALLSLVLAWILAPREETREAIDSWLNSWARRNPANVGIQWKCGQETGIRLMHLLMAAELMYRWGGVAACTGFHQLVAEHCRRISRTMIYAVGQDNNHGTSEAAALFAGGLFLKCRASGDYVREGSAWALKGRRWLENRVLRLVLTDGSFSQHSTNYHRVMLDTCSFAETWRRWFEREPFSEAFNERCRAATRWLLALTDTRSGDVPNLGANDGARLFVMHRLPFRDFRPTVQWAATVFGCDAGYGPGPWNEPLVWLGIEPVSHRLPRAESCLLGEGGYAKLVAGQAWSLLRLPKYRFRPSQSDGLHLDLWVSGRNVVRDGGSYSYSAAPEWLGYFSGTASHSTIEFDDRDQMPRLSRFLFGRWLECDQLEYDAKQGRVAAGYRDYLGATHRREVQLTDNRCVVTDEVSGFGKKAVLRWRLIPGAWSRTSDGVVSETVSLAVSATGTIDRIELRVGQESLYYSRMTTVPVLEIEVHAPMTITTQIGWVR